MFKMQSAGEPGEIVLLVKQHTFPHEYYSQQKTSTGCKEAETQVIVVKVSQLNSIKHKPKAIFGNSRHNIFSRPLQKIDVLIINLCFIR